MKFTEENLTPELLEEVKPLLEKHWNEIAHFKDIPLDPDYDLYIKMQNLKMLRCYSMRDGDGQLVGYSVYMVRHNMHYRSCLTAVEDIIFVHPEKRGYGMFFISWCDDQLKALGVQVVTHHIKFDFDWSKALMRQGYEKTDMQLCKRLDK